MRRIDFVFFDAGGGHRSAATALKAIIEQQARPWDVRLVNLQEVLDCLDIFRKVTRIRLQDLYNRMLSTGWTLGAAQWLTLIHQVIRLSYPAQVRTLARYWASNTPDMVVSLVPNFNKALFEGFKRANPGGIYATALTDFADYPPHFWIEQQDQYFVCGTEKALDQARMLGHPDAKTFLTSGMILRPDFYRTFDHDRSVERIKLGLDPDRPTGIVLFGGHGSPAMEVILRALQNSRRDLQLILICGRNQKLESKLLAFRSRFPCHIVGLTAQVPYYMKLADFFIGKPGPGSISEAVAMELPVIIERNVWTLPQERYNADWVLERRVGLVVTRFKQEIVDAVDGLLEPAVLARYRAHTAAISNRALFEIPDILAGLIDPPPTAGPASARNR